MDENLHKDNLEDFFKEALDNMDQEASKDAWDLPSSKSWEKIHAEIQDKEPRRFGLGFWVTAIAASLVLLVLAYQVFYTNEKVNNINHQVQQNQEILKKIEQQTKDKIENTPSSFPEKNTQENIVRNTESSNKQAEKTVKESPLREEKTASNLPIPNSKKSKEKTKSTTPNDLPSNQQIDIVNTKVETIQQTKTNSIATVPVEKNLNNNKTPQNNSSNPKEDNSLINSSRESSFSQISRIEDLPYNYFNSIEQAKITLPFIDMPIELPSVHKGFYVGAFFTPNIEQLKLGGSDNMKDDFKDLIKTQKEKSFNWTLGLQLGYQLSSHWSLESGLNFNRSTKLTTHPLMLQHNSANEHVNTAGELENEYDYTLKTSSGDIDTDISLIRANSPLPEGTPLPIEIQSNLEQTSLGIPLLVKYQWGKRKFHFSIKTGIVSNFSLHQELAIKSVTSKRFGIRHRKTRIKTPKLNQGKNNSFDYQLSLGIDYALTKNWRLQLSPSFTQRLSPLKLKDDLKVYPQFVSLQLGTSYYF